MTSKADESIKEEIIVIVVKPEEPTDPEEPTNPEYVFEVPEQIILIVGQTGNVGF